MSAASRRAGRQPESTRLVAVSKTVEPSRIREACLAGQMLFGENRVQEARSKQEAVGPSAVWHLVGHLQRNKSKEAARLFQMIHSVDSLGLLHDLERHAAGRQEPLEALIQVNLAAEPGKHGVGREELPEILAAAAGMRHIKVQGLMILPPYDPEPERSRPQFRELAELAAEMDRRKFENVSMRELSMGMSEDFEVAIEEGSTLIRIGRALFGERPPVANKERA
ncbi:MAG: YggS family pyridoxal phosphate-dependent enzyme [Acidobacteria bacterium]|nr:YggS family pyridoxal phosphate-dependent enzyme [Acidobacteriota bacterium]